MSQRPNPHEEKNYKSVQGHMVKTWDEKITNGKGVADYIKRHATKKKLGDFGNLIDALDEMPRDEQDKFYHTIIPQMVSTAKFTTSGPHSGLLKRFKPNNVTLSLTRFEVASLLANAFLCTFPKSRTHPSLSFSRIYDKAGGAPQKEKIKCMVYYFGSIFNDFDVQLLRDTVTYKKSIVATAPEWRGSNKPVIPMNLVSKGSIANAHCMAQVNFSAREFGGNVLDWTALREEMWCISCPEMIVAKLFCKEMQDNEAIVVEGVLQFSDFEGSGPTFKCLGPRSEDSFRGPHSVISMNALNFSHSPSNNQYNKRLVDRELLKAYAGFTAAYSNTIATGNWGCGIFCGNPVLKAKIQNIAASQACKALFFYPFNDPELEEKIEKEAQLDKPLTVGQAYKELLQWCADKTRDDGGTPSSSEHSSPAKKCKTESDSDEFSTNI